MLSQVGDRAGIRVFIGGAVLGGEKPKDEPGASQSGDWKKRAIRYGIGSWGRKKTVSSDDRDISQ